MFEGKPFEQVSDECIMGLTQQAYETDDWDKVPVYSWMVKRLVKEVLWCRSVVTALEGIVAEKPVPGTTCGIKW